MTAIALICLAFLGLLPSCADAPDGLTVVVRPADRALLGSVLEHLQDPRIQVVEAADPGSALREQDGWAIAVAPRSDCSECYRMERAERRLTVAGGAKLGMQYGLAAALEAFGYRFAHPRHTKKPPRIHLDADATPSGEHAPQVDVRRGLHLHTLHPIEAMFDFWLPGDDHLSGAKRVIDFVVANRGNYVQWCALDDITTAADQGAAWRAHTRAINQAAHARGVRTGIALQLFGTSNLQKAYDLTDNSVLDPKVLTGRLQAILDGNGFDAVNISFGEFFGVDPGVFVAALDQAYAAMQAVQPGIEVMATIHVGNYPDLQITWQGKQQLYYFLVQYANPAIVPWIHTVMYYNLFEDAGQAYLHDDFAQHRAFLLDRLQQGKKAGYFPETAYWVAFDCSVPMMLPLYVRSRWEDLQGIAKVAHLADHVLFSSGWEWGYWLNDVTALRMSYERPASWGDAVAQQLAAWGEAGKSAAQLLVKIGDMEHDALIGQRLAPYLAGRDLIIDLGEKMGKIGAPTRPALDGIATLPAAQRTALKTTVAQLAAFSQALAPLAKQLQQLDRDGEPWLAELSDGAAITALRAHFVQQLWALAVKAADEPLQEQEFAPLEVDLDAAKQVIARRQGGLWDGKGTRLVQDAPNPTRYQYGYLRDAHSLCFWRRELTQLRNSALKLSDPVPACVM